MSNIAEIRPLLHDVLTVASTTLPENQSRRIIKYIHNTIYTKNANTK